MIFSRVDIYAERLLMSLLPLVLIEELGPHWTDFREI
jgi:hypothetical protein